MKKLQKALMMILSAILCLSFVQSTGIQAQQTEPEPVTDSVRKEENFNRNWKFIRRDDPNAFQSDYSDENWYNVCLPHDFSIPYFMEQSFYTGVGWYRKTFEISADQAQSIVKLDFEGVFHTIDLYINGEKVGTHQGGYTGFEFNITPYIHEGENILAARVDNTWNPQLAPRAGDHNFTGGIYRNVNLITENPVHVTWYGTFAQTPNVSKASSDLRMQAEVENLKESSVSAHVRHTLKDADGQIVAQFSSSAVAIEPGEIHNFDDTYSSIANPHLWSVDDPYLYTVVTEVFEGETLVDSVTTSMGFRWCEWTADRGFFLNGEHVWINGVNAHQDHAGWCNAVSDSALERDVEMVKEAGFNFIRGSHYPHSPSYTQACDENGILYWSEAAFWFIGGAGGEGTGESSADYRSNGYPTVAADQPAFEQSCMDMLEDMIRIHRNHPSIVVWSMGNETFFQNVVDDSGVNTNEKKKALITRMCKKAKELDPTRAAGLGGTQREGYDRIEGVEVAGYNGDGASIGAYQNPGIPNVVAEYGSHTINRGEGDEFKPYYDCLQSSNNLPIQYEWRSGAVLWCMFHHGTVAARSYGDMGIVDYYRLPMKEWYWYRKQYNPEHPDYESSKAGTPTKIQLTASDLVLSDDGRQDTHLIATLVDDHGDWIGAKRKVTLTVIDGPGIFPTGKTFIMDPDSENKSMLDGKGAIEFRSYYAGTTTIRAESEGLEPAEIMLTTTGNSKDESEPAIETMYGSFMNNSGIVLTDIENAPAYELRDLNGVPCTASSNEADRQNVLDKDPKTSWTASVPGSGQYVNATMEHGEVILYKAAVLFDGEKLPFTLQGRQASGGDWETIVSYDAETIKNAPEEITFFGTNPYRNIRVLFDHLEDDQYASFSELKLYSLKSVNEPIKTGYQYLSDLELPETVKKNKTMSGMPLEANDVFFKNGISIPSGTSFEIENYTPEEGGYGQFETVAYNPNKESVILKLTAKDQTIFEKEFAYGESVNIALSIYRCPTLKIEVSGKSSISLGEARFGGVKRSLLSEKAAGTKAEYRANYETLTPGTRYEGTIQLTLPKAQNVIAAWTLQDAAGNLLDLSSRTVSVEAGKAVSIPVEMQLDENLEPGAVLRVMLWNKETLAPVCQDLFVTTMEDASGKPVEADKYPESDGNSFEMPSVTTLVKGEEMTKTGEWDRWPASGSQAGTRSGYETFVESNSWQNTALSYTFNGTEVKVYAKKDGSQSGCEVYIDGELVETVSTKVNDGSNSYPLVFSKTLESGEYVIRLVPTGKFGFDALEVTGPGSVSKPEYVEGTEGTTVIGSDASIIKSDGWGQWKDESAGDYETYNNTAGAQLSYTFTGTGISMVTKFDGGKTGADVYIDGEYYGRYSCNENTNDYRTGIDIQDLSFGTHEFRLVTTGKFGFKTITTVYGQLEDRSELEKAVEEARALKQADYTNYDAQFEAILFQAEFALNSYSFSQAQIDAFTQALTQAIAGLKRPSTLLDTEFAHTIVHAIETMRTENWNPQTENRSVFAQAYDKALEAFASDDASNAGRLGEQLEAGIAAIQEGMVSPDLSALQLVISKGDSLEKTAYPQTQMIAFEEALSKAKEIEKDPQSQEEIDAETIELSTALYTLRKVPDANDPIFSAGE